METTAFWVTYGDVIKMEGRLFKVDGIEAVFEDGLIVAITFSDNSACLMWTVSPQAKIWVI